MNMLRLLYISSSHGRGMDIELMRIDPFVEVMGIWRGGAKIEDAELMVQSRMPAILDFNPHEIIIHLGHNDIC